MDDVAIKKPNKINNRLANFCVANLLFFAISTVMLVLSKVYSVFIDDVCYIKKATGIICPSCGMTRSVINLLKLNFVEAFLYHPIIVILFFYIVVVDLFYLVDTIKHNNKKRLIYRIDVSVYVFVFLYLLQYIIRLLCIFNKIDCSFMYLNI